MKDKQKHKCLYCGESKKERNEWEDGRPIDTWWECNCVDAIKERQVTLKISKLRKQHEMEITQLRLEYPLHKYKVIHIDEHKLVKL